MCGISGRDAPSRDETRSGSRSGTEGDARLGVSVGRSAYVRRYERQAEIRTRLSPHGGNRGRNTYGLVPRWRVGLVSSFFHRADQDAEQHGTRQRRERPSSWTHHRVTNKMGRGRRPVTQQDGTDGVGDPADKKGRTGSEIHRPTRWDGAGSRRSSPNENRAGEVGDCTQHEQGAGQVRRSSPNEIAVTIGTFGLTVRTGLGDLRIAVLSASQIDKELWRSLGGRQCAPSSGRRLSTPL